MDETDVNAGIAGVRADSNFQIRYEVAGNVVASQRSIDRLNQVFRLQHVEIVNGQSWSLLHLFQSIRLETRHKRVWQISKG